MRTERPRDAEGSRGRIASPHPRTAAFPLETRTPPNISEAYRNLQETDPGSGGGGGVRLRPGLWRLREAHAQGLQLSDLLLAQLGEPLRHVLDRFTEPLFHVLRLCADDTTPHDMLEELVAGLLERRRLGWGRVAAPGLFLLFGHVVGDRVCCYEEKYKKIEARLTVPLGPIFRAPRDQPCSAAAPMNSSNTETTVSGTSSGTSRPTP